MKTLVVYYSRTGNNKYLAEKIAQTLGADVEAIAPRLNLFPALLLCSAINVSPGIRPLTHRVNEYDALIVCGPVWMGRLIAPLRDVIRVYGASIKQLYFATCCGSSDSQKDDKFGYASVFLQAQRVAGNGRIQCEAFPIGLVLPEDKQHDNDAMMKARLSEATFTGQIQKKLENFLQTIAKEHLSTT